MNHDPKMTPRASQELIRRCLTRIANAAGRDRIAESAIDVWAESLAPYTSNEIQAAVNKAITTTGNPKLADVHRIIEGWRSHETDRPASPGMTGSGEMTPEAMAWSMIVQEVREQGPNTWTPAGRARVAAHLLREWHRIHAGGPLDSRGTKRAVREWLGKYTPGDWEQVDFDSLAPSSGRVHAVTL
jgi:hypothetical protein